MKKILIAITAVLVMSGCDSATKKSLTCTSKNAATNGLTTMTTYDIEYNNDEIKYITITYDYNQDNNVDGVNSDTDGLTDTPNNNNVDGDDVIDGVVGDAIDETVEGVRETILDIAGIRNRFENQLSTYDNIEGFTYDVDADNNNQYKIIYKIDMNKISDNDLRNFNVSRNLDDLRTNYESLGYTCK